MNKNILEVKNVCVRFDKGDKYILKNISFGVKAGEIVSIIGMNGTGKSTLLKSIIGVQKVSSGSIVIKKHISLAYIPQKINIDRSFPISVKEYINIYNPHVSLEDIITYFTKFQIIDLLETNISLLSGGEFQKMLIISSLLTKPDLLVLDEPTSGVDIIGEQNFYKTIHDLKKEFPSISIVMVSHNIHLVYKNSDKVVCLHKDNFCCHGTPAQLKEQKEVQEIFGNYMAPYKHSPDSKRAHK